MCTCMHTHISAYIHIYTCSICQHTTRAAISPSLALSGARAFSRSLSVTFSLTHSLSLLHTQYLSTHDNLGTLALSLSLPPSLSISLSFSLTHTPSLSDTHSICQPATRSARSPHVHICIYTYIHTYRQTYICRIYRHATKLAAQHTYTYTWTNTYIRTNLRMQYLSTGNTSGILTTRTCTTNKHVQTCMNMYTCSIYQHATKAARSQKLRGVTPHCSTAYLFP